MSAPKGQGTLVYIDVDSDDEYIALTCVRRSKLSGYDRGIVEDEPCLEDSQVEQDSGDLKLSPFTGTVLWDVNEAVAESLDTAIQNDTEIKMCVKVPKTTPVYVYMVGKLIKLEPSDIERTKKYARDFEFLPTAIPTKSATAPTLEA